MIRFLFKGILRDRSRSLFPILTVMTGVMLTVFFYSYIQGATGNFFDTAAKYQTGHVKIMSRAYAEEADQIPNDLAYVGLQDLLGELNTRYPDMIWTPRIQFGALLDIPDENGETRAQGPVMGMAVDLFSSRSPEWEILNLQKAVVRGRLPEKPGEILVSEGFMERLGVQAGETATLIGSTMYGGMAIANFTIAGSIDFGVSAMDRGAIVADLADIQDALDMQDAAGEVLGFFGDYVFQMEESETLKAEFNAAYADDENDEFAPVMKGLVEQSIMGDMMGILEMFTTVVLFIFISAMSIVLWNAGILGSLRRYGEIGVRLAIGESKGHLYRSMITESMLIGFVGSVLGTALGLAFSYYLQAKGFDISHMMKNASLMITDVIRARVTFGSYVIGFFPGLVATFLGTAVAGLGIYRRKTSQLMKELEA
jgi:putative ABC transport system permease protein